MLVRVNRIVEPGYFMLCNFIWLALCKYPYEKTYLQALYEHTISLNCTATGSKLKDEMR